VEQQGTGADEDEHTRDNVHATDLKRLARFPFQEKQRALPWLVKSVRADGLYLVDDPGA
jgi:hypothetical protein